MFFNRMYIIMNLRGCGTILRVLIKANNHTVTGFETKNLLYLPTLFTHLPSRIVIRVIIILISRWKLIKKP